MKTKTLKSLEIIEKNPFPIIVTEDLPRNELANWELNFKMKKIKYVIKDLMLIRNGKKLYHLRREITKIEKEEIAQGKWNIINDKFNKG